MVVSRRWISSSTQSSCVEEPAGLLGAQVPAHPADHIDRHDHPVAGGGLADVHDPFADAPKLHEQALEAEAVGEEPQPEQMALNPVHLGPDDPQELGPRRGFDRHQLLDPHAVAVRVDHRADPADPLDDLDHLVEIADVGQPLQPAVDVAQVGDGLGDPLIHHRQLQVNGLGQHRVLGPEGDHGLAHQKVSTSG